MVKVRKAIKGAAADKGKPAANDPDAALKAEMLALEMQEQMRKKMEARRKELKKWQEEEERFAKLNRYRINNQWRKLMRLAKIESLRKELEILSQSHEREVDMKDAIIQMLDRDLDEAEEQFSMALRSHLANVDEMIELHHDKIHKLETEFESELSVLQDEFDKERTQVLSQHAREKKELLDIMNHVENEFNDSEAEARQEFESQCEEMKNKAMEDLNLLNMVMMTAIEELERHFESAHHNYVNNTESRTQKFKALSAKDRDCAQEIQRKAQRLQRLQDAVNNWKLKISGNVRECEDRNRLLREEKESIGRHFQELKNRMNKFRDNEAKFLSDLTSKSHKALATLEDKQNQVGAWCQDSAETDDLGSHCFAGPHSNHSCHCFRGPRRILVIWVVRSYELRCQAEKLLKFSELNRKLETEREKIVPFEVTDAALANVPKVPKDLQAEAQVLTSYAKGPQGQALEEWNMLDEFFSRYNKVLLDGMALDTEQAKLKRENSDLRSILKQYLDGISVTDEGMAQHNSLLVVNNRTNVLHRAPAMAQHIPTLEANSVVREMNKMRQPISQHG